MEVVIYVCVMLHNEFLMQSQISFNVILYGLIFNVVEKCLRSAEIKVMFDKRKS